MRFCDERIQKHLLRGGKIKRRDADYSIYLNGNDTVCCKHGYIYIYDFKRDDLTADDWEIVEPEYDWDKIIEDKILCLFSDNKGFKYNIFSTLRMKDNNLYYTDNGTTYKYCKPFNPADFNIAKNIKEYEK